MADQTNDNLTWLMQWYAAQCDGEWEHHYGVVIQTLDNPGWLLEIDLNYTDLAGKPFETSAVNMQAPDGDPAPSWHHCKVQGELFQTSGGAHDLMTLIGVFRDWVEDRQH